MTVFNTFWKVVKKYKGTVIGYTIMLVIFGTINMASNDTGSMFTNSKPDILIVNEDKENKVTDNLVNYLQENSNVVRVEDNEESRNDALFYRDVNYIIYIPEGYGNMVLNGENPTINVKSTNNYPASLAEMMLSRYIKVQNIYLKQTNVASLLTEKINKALDEKVTVEKTSKLDTNEMAKASRYFNFASYTIMGAVIFIICLVITSFHKKEVYKRVIVSSMEPKKHNRYILGASLIYALAVWLLYVILGIFVLKDTMLSLRGVMYALNTLVFTFCTLTIALLISSLTNNKGAITGIVNVVALGSAFLCGAFIPTEWLPEIVVKISRIIPTYWYTNSNNLLANMESVSLQSLENVFINMAIIIAFSILFIIINNIVSNKKKKIG